MEGSTPSLLRHHLRMVMVRLYPTALPTLVMPPAVAPPRGPGSRRAVHRRSKSRYDLMGRLADPQPLPISRNATAPERSRLRARDSAAGHLRQTLQVESLR